MMHKWLKIIVSLCIVLALTVLIASIRGNVGSPTSANLDQPEWKENGPFELSPERGRFALIYSIVEDKSLFFSLPLARFVTPDLGYKDGKYVSLFAPAVSYLAIPGYLLGRLYGATQFGSFATIAVFALGNVWLIYLISQKLGITRLASLLAGFIFLFATPGFAYAVNLYQHHVSTFLILSACYLVLNYKSWFSLALLWLLTMASLTVDYPNLILMLPIAVFSLPHLIEVSTAEGVRIKLHLLKWLAIVGAILPLTFFFWFNEASYGNPFQFSGTIQSVSRVDENGMPGIDLSQAKANIQNVINAEKQDNKTTIGFFKSRDLLNGLYILIFSQDRGLIFFTPVLLISILGMIALYKTHPRPTALLLSIMTMNILLYGMWGDPWGGWAFGARYLIPSYAILAIFVGTSLSHWRKNIVALMIFLSLALFSIYVNTAGALGSSANPPKVQVLQLEKITGRQEKYTYMRNIDMLRVNTSKSFVFRSWANKYLSSWEYFLYVFAAITTIFIVMTSMLYLSKRGDKS